MPYLFAILVVANAVLLGYYLFVPQHPESAALKEAQASLTQPMTFENTSDHVPPLIGTKK